MKTRTEQTVRTEMGILEVNSWTKVGECYAIYVPAEKATYNLEVFEIIETREVECEEDDVDFFSFLGE